ncbi:MAG: response regulator [Neomegalonema sp.]|nr:response regulator [Neomegalonema sp.]
MRRSEAQYSAPWRERRASKPMNLAPKPQSVEVPVPLWASTAGLAGGVVFCGLAAASNSPFETVALLAGAAAAGGLGVYGMLERLTQRSSSSDWAAGGEARALIDTVEDPMAILDRFGAVLATNEAGGKIGRAGKAPSRATHLLGEARDPDQIVYRLLGAALSGRAAETIVDVRPNETRRISVWPIGGGLALWRQSSAADEERATAAPHAPTAATVELGPKPFETAAEQGAEIGWFRIDSAGRLVETDRVFSRWLGARAGRGVEAPSLRTVLPEARRPEGGAISARSRLIGAPGAPREVSVILAPLGVYGESVGVAAPAAQAPAAPPPAMTKDGAPEASEAALFDAAPYGLLLLNTDGRILKANLAGERIFAALGGEGPVMGGNGDFLIDWVAEKDAERVRRAFEAAQRGGRGAEATLLAEWGARGADKGATDVAGALEPGEVEISFRLHSEDEDGLRVVAFLQDASERRGLERNVAQAQKLQAVGELAGGVAHDFNNMLTVIIGGCETLTARKTADDPDNEELTVIAQSARRAGLLVSQLLAYSRKQRLAPTVANLTEVVSDLTMMLTRMVGGRFFLQRDLAEDLWPVMVDVNQLGQAVTNLVVNARDAMPEGGRIKVRTENVVYDAPFKTPTFTIAPGQYVRLDVADEGSGVPPAIQAKIFEPFFTTKKVGQGTGLGLSMVYGIVKQSQGYLLLNSPPGEGATFSIYLPRASDEAVRAAQEAEREAAERAQAATATAPGDKVILLVEDEAAVRNIASKALSSRGYEVLEAADGAEATEILEDASIHIDLMLSDVVMPDIDGPSLLKNLGSRRPDMKTVFMTGYARDNFAETLEDSFAEQRAFGVLHKPFSLDSLRQAVAEALGADQSDAKKS